MWSPADRRLAAPLAALALLLSMVALSRDFGFTWDERFQQKYGEQVWDYLHGRLPRSDFDTDFANQYLYGGLFELTAVAVQHAVPADIYVVRHAVNSVFGWLGIVFCGLLAARVFGPRAGWLAAGLLAVSPRYFGHSMNNPKDVPFAALSIAALYVLLTVRPRPPHLTWGHAATLAAVIALATNVRPLGLMLLAYTAVVLVALSAWAAFRRSSGERLVGGIAGTGAQLLALALVAIPAGTLAWPWAQGQPFTRPIEAFLIASRASWAGAFGVLYGGEYLAADRLPWHYVPAWLGMTLPPVVLVGLALSPLAWRRGTAVRAGLVALGTFALVPIVGAIARHATLYDGIRHLLFVVPPLVALAAAGWVAALDAVRGRTRAAAIVVLAVGVAEPFAFQLRNHPNQVVYFSPIMGGPRAAFGRFDMDYWGNSMLQAVSWAADQAERARMPLAVSGNPRDAVEADAGRFPSVWLTRRWSTTHHLDIRLLRGSHDGVVELANRRDVLYRATMADGTPLAVVLPGPAYGEVAQQLRLAAGER